MIDLRPGVRYVPVVHTQDRFPEFNSWGDLVLYCMILLAISLLVLGVCLLLYRWLAGRESRRQEKAWGDFKDDS